MGMYEQLGNGFSQIGTGSDRCVHDVRLSCHCHECWEDENENASTADYLHSQCMHRMFPIIRADETYTRQLATMEWYDAAARRLYAAIADGANKSETIAAIERTARINRCDRVTLYHAIIALPFLLFVYHSDGSVTEHVYPTRDAATNAIAALWAAGSVTETVLHDDVTGKLVSLLRDGMEYVGYVSR